VFVIIALVFPLAPQFPPKILTELIEEVREIFPNLWMQFTA